VPDPAEAPQEPEEAHRARRSAGIRGAFLIPRFLKERNSHVFFFVFGVLVWIKAMADNI
jgi:hypothetical protein